MVCFFNFANFSLIIVFWLFLKFLAVRFGECQEYVPWECDFVFIDFKIKHVLRFFSHFHTNSFLNLLVYWFLFFWLKFFRKSVKMFGFRFRKYFCSTVRESKTARYKLYLAMEFFLWPKKWSIEISSNNSQYINLLCLKVKFHFRCWRIFD